MMSVDTVIFSVFFGVLGILNVSGNVLVTAVIARNKSMRTPVNYLLLSLAVSDLLVGITSIASRVVLPYIPHPQGNAGDVFCRLITTDNLFIICGHVSALILAVVAYERYQAVVHPYTVTEKITSKKMMAAVIVCWAISVAMCFNWIHLARIDSQTQTCGYDLKSATAFYEIYRYLNCVSFFVPFLVMVILYGRVVWTMVKKQDQVLSRQQLAVTRLRRKVTTMLLIASFAYIATCGPLIVIMLLQTSIALLPTVYQVKTLMIALNSTVNAFIYALFSLQFRQGFKSILSCSSLAENRTNPVKISEGHRHSDTIDTKL